jgi:hypothetical protein
MMATKRQRAVASTAVLATLGLITLPASSWAQAPRNNAAATGAAQAGQGKPGQGVNEIARGSGTLEAQQADTLKIATEDKKEKFLVVRRDAQIRFTGEADLEWLTPGLFVRFSSPFDAQGKASGKLKTLEVFVPAQALRMSPEEIREQTPGIFSEGKEPPPGAKGLFTDKEPAGNRDPKGKDNKAGDRNAGKKPAAEPPVATGQSYRVIGQVVGLKDQTLTVSTPGRPVQIELDPDLVITVTSRDLSFTNKGDSVTYAGITNTAQPDWVQVERLDIKAEKKLEQAVVTRPARGRTSGRNRDADKPAAGKPDDQKNANAGNRKPAGK